MPNILHPSPGSILQCLRHNPYRDHREVNRMYSQVRLHRPSSLGGHCKSSLIFCQDALVIENLRKTDLHNFASYCQSIHRPDLDVFDSLQWHSPHSSSVLDSSIFNSLDCILILVDLEHAVPQTNPAKLSKLAMNKTVGYLCLTS